MGTKPQTVRDLMQTQVYTLQRNDKLLVADELMKQERIRHLPVLDEYGDLAGILSQRDLFRGALLRALGYGSRAEDLMLRSVAVKEAMVEPVHTASPDTPLRDAAAKMLAHRIGCLPVVDNGKLVGMISESDMLRLVAQAQ
ncbi:MAG: CBS domain-containing protein [Burkholderiales bacterium]